MFAFMVVPHGANAMVGIECEDNKVLVAYFSATGNTAQVADKIYESLNEMMTVDADLVEIKPEQPYTDKDLNWNDKNSRSSIEMSGNSERPAVATKIKDIDTLFWKVTISPKSRKLYHLPHLAAAVWEIPVKTYNRWH